LQSERDRHAARQKPCGDQGGVFRPFYVPLIAADWSDVFMQRFPASKPESCQFVRKVDERRGL